MLPWGLWSYPHNWLWLCSHLCCHGTCGPSFWVVTYIEHPRNLLLHPRKWLLFFMFFTGASACSFLGMRSTTRLLTSSSSSRSRMSFFSVVVGCALYSLDAVYNGFYYFFSVCYCGVCGFLVPEFHGVAQAFSSHCFDVVHISVLVFG